MNNYTLKNFLDIKASYAATFSPDGTKISYLDNSTGTTQLYLANSDGTNIRQLTDFSDRLMFAGFFPKQNLILFGKDKDGNEHTQFHIYDVEADTIRDLTSNDKALHMIGNISWDGTHIAYSSNELNGKDFDIYTMNVETGEKRCLYKEDGWCSSPVFSPDRTKIIFSRPVSVVRSDLILLDLSDDSSEVLFKDEGYNYFGMPVWLSDSSGFYFVSNKDSDFICLDFYDLNTRITQRIFDFGWDVMGVALSKDDKYLVVTINEGGYYRAKIFQTSDMSQISNKGMPEDVAGFKWSNDASKLLFNSGASTRTISAWVWEREKDEAKQLTPNHQVIPPDVMVSPELAQYKSFDGLEIPVFLYKPKISSEGPLPVVVQIHGGPESQYQPAFNPLTQYLVYNGYAVAAPNVRGSTGYGKKFTQLDDKGKRLDSVKDIVYLRHFLKDRPEFDENRIALTGGSYGGYMVLANLAFFPEYWAAGVDIVGISNLVTFLENTSIWRRELREAEYGSLEHDREMLESVSPINKAEDITAPLFIIHGANDPRVPLSEAEQMHKTLKDLERDVELLVYHDEGHGLAKLENRIDAWTKVVAFLDKRLK